MTEALQELGAHIEMKRSDCVLSWSAGFDELCIEIAPSSVKAFMTFLKTDPQCRFSTLVDMTAVDYPSREKRFDMVYLFLSMYRNQRIRVKTAVREKEMLDTITEAYPAANWPEREVFDMFGILFADHPDMRRLLTDYGFRGHPLLKDFPTTGYTELRYDEVEKRVVYEPVTLTQEYRQFDFMSPWEGAEYILPGDEKGKGA